MREIFVGVAIALVLGLLFLLTIPKEADEASICNGDYLRIHIRANSNDAQDQYVKYAVKNDIVEALTPIVSQAISKESARQLLTDNIGLMESVADNTLRREGFNYSSNIKIAVEHFPTRSYNEFVLESGKYDAIIVNLGQAVGNNWWCVVYPPLCFTDSQKPENTVYKSKILEIINKFFN